MNDRSWERASSWQPTSRGDAQNQRIQNGHRSGRPNKNSKNGKKNHSHNQQKRDWRGDDGNLNKYETKFL
jgi:CTD kinase subunit alpha